MATGWSCASPTSSASARGRSRSSPEAAASMAAAGANPVGTRGALGLDGGDGLSHAPVEMHAEVGGPARTGATIAGGDRVHHVDLPYCCGGVLAAERFRRRLGGRERERASRNDAAAEKGFGANRHSVLPANQPSAILPCPQSPSQGRGSAGRRRA